LNPGSNLGEILMIQWEGSIEIDLHGINVFKRCREITAVYYENHMNKINKLYERKCRGMYM
jgi:hypothetical protein